MIQHFDIEQPSGRYDLDGEGNISGRGGRVAGGMVMDGDEGGGLLAHRVAEDFGHPDLRLIYAPAIYRLSSHDAVFGV